MQSGRGWSIVRCLSTVVIATALASCTIQGSIKKLNPVGTVTIVEKELTEFTITGVRGSSGSDTTADAVLSNSLNPYVVWQASTGASGYKVTIFENDETTVACAQETTTKLFYDFASCTLTAGLTYKVRVRATSASGGMDATNSLFTFVVASQAPVAINDGPIYVMSGSSVTISPLGNDIDPDGLGLSITNAADGAGGLGTTTETSTAIVFSATAPGQDTVSYTITNASGMTATGTITINVMTAHTWTGAGGNAFWNNATNWCGSINVGNSGCTGTGAVPGVGDIARFDATCGATCDATINANASVLGLVMATGYTGTLTQGTGRTVTVGTTGFLQASGTFVGGDSNITNSGIWRVHDATFTSTSATFRQQNAIDFQGATFDHNNGSIVVALPYNTTRTASWGNTTVNNLSFLSQTSFDGWVLNNSGTVTVSGALAMSETQNVNDSHVYGGTFHIKGDASNTATGTHRIYSSMNLLINGTGAQALSTSGGAGLPNVEINKTSGTVTFSPTYTNFGDFKYVAGTVGMPTNFIISGYSNDTLDLDAAGLAFNNLEILAMLTYDGYDLVINGTHTVNGDLNLNRISGTARVDLLGGILSVKGNVSSSQITRGTAQLHVTGNSNQTISGSGWIQNLTIASTGGTVAISGSPHFYGSFTHTSGAVTTTGSTVTFRDSFATAYALSPGTVIFDDVVFHSSTSADTVAFNISGTLTIADSLTFAQPDGNSASSVNTGTIRVGGDVAVTGQAGWNGSATIEMYGSGSSTISVSPTSNLPNGTFVLNKTGGASVTLASAVSLDAAGQDFTLTSGTVMMAGYNFTVADQLTMAASTVIDKACGTLTVAGSPVADGAYGSGTIQGGGGGATPDISISDASATEGSPLTFTVSLSGPRCAGDVTVNYATADGTATTANSDYTAIGSTALTFSPGETSKTFTVATTADTTAEANETVLVNLSGASGGAIIDSTGVGTIVNDDTDAYMWTGLAGDGLWSTAGNWFGGAAPGAGHTAIFNNMCTNCNATIDANISVTGIRLDNGYTGTLTQGAGRTITLAASGYRQGSGTFVGSDANITMNLGQTTGDMTVGGGSFTSTSGVLKLAVNVVSASSSRTLFSVASGVTFIHNNGTFEFNGYDAWLGNSVYTIDVPGTLDLYNIIFSGNPSIHSTGHRVADGDTLNVFGNLSHVGGTLRGAIELHGNLSASSPGGSDGTAWLGIVTMVGTGNQTYSGTATALAPQLIINKVTGNVTPASADASFSGLRLLQGNFTAPTGTLRLGFQANSTTAGSRTLLEVASGTTFTHNGGTLHLDARDVQWGTADYTLDVPTTLTVNNVTIQGQDDDAGYLLGAGDSIVVEGNLSHVQGYFNGVWHVHGNYSTTSAHLSGSAAITLDGTGDQLVTATATTQPSGTVTINKPSGNVNLASNWILNTAGQDLTLTAGRINMNGFNLTINDQLTMGAGTIIDKGCGTLTRAGSPVADGAYGSGTIQGGSGVATPDISISDASATEGSPLTFTVSLSGYRCAGDVTMNYATADGTATTANSDYTAIGSTALTFSPGETSKTFTVATTADTTAEPNETVLVNLSGASGGTIIDSTGVGTIINDDTGAYMWTGLAGDGLWSTAGNWFGGAAPGAGHTAILNNLCTNCNATIDTNISVAGIRLDSGYTGTLTQGAGRTVTVGTSGWAQGSGTFVGGDSLISVGASFSVAAGTFTNTSNILRITGNFTLGATTTSSFGASTIELIGAVSPTITTNGAELGTLRVNLNASGFRTVSTSGAARVQNLILDISGGSSGVIYGGQFDVLGDVTANVASGGSGSIRLIGTGAQTVTGLAAGIMPALEVAKPSGTAALSGHVAVAGNFVVTSGTLNPGTAIVALAGGSSASLNVAGVTLPDLRVTKAMSGTGSISVVGTVSVGDLTLAKTGASALFLTGGTLSASGNLSISGLDGGTGTISLNGSANQTVTGVGTGTLPNFVIDKSGGTATFSGEVPFANNFTYTAGNVDFGTSTVTFAGGGSATINSGALRFNHLKIAKSSGSSITLTLTGSVRAVDVTVNAGGTGVGLNSGPLVISGNLDYILNNFSGSAGLIFDGTGTQTITYAAGTMPGGAVTVDKPSGTVELASNVSWNVAGQDLVMTAGRINMNGFNLTINDQLTMAASTIIDKGCGTLTRAGSPVADGAYGSGTIQGGGVATPDISISDASATEGSPLTFTVSLSGQRCAGNVTVNYATANGTATTANSDYTAIGATALTFSPGETSKTFTVATTADTTAEANETVLVNLSGASGGAIIDSTGVGTIVNDDTSAYMWTGLAGDGLWSTAGNWFGGAAPGVGHTAIFNNMCTNCNATINASISVAGIRLDNGYTGTLTQGAGNTVTVGASGWAQGSGTFAGGNAAININGPYAGTGGTFTATSGTLRYATTSLTFAAGHSFASSGLVEFVQTTNFTLSGNTVVIQNLHMKLDSTGGWSASFNGTITVNGTLTLEGTHITNPGTLNGSGTVVAMGDVVCAGTGVRGPFLVRMSGSGTKNLSCASTTVLPSLEIASTGTVQVLGSPRLRNHFTYTSGTVSVGTNKITFEQGDVGATYTFGDLELNDVQFNVSSSWGYAVTSSGNLTINGELTLNGHTANTGLFNGSGVLLAKGDVTCLGTGVAGNSLLRLVGSGTQTLNCPVTALLLSTEIASTGTVNLVGEPHFARNFTYTSGTVNAGTSKVHFGFTSGHRNWVFNGLTLNDVNLNAAQALGFSTAGSGTLTVSGDLTIVGAAAGASASGGTVRVHNDLTITGNGLGGTLALQLVGTGAQTITQATSSVIPGGALTINKASGTVELASAVSLATAGQDLTLTAGRINMNAFNLTINDQLTMGAGTIIDKGCGTLTRAGSPVADGAYGSGTIQGGSGVATPDISITDASAIEGNPLTFTVSLSGPRCAGDVTVNYATADGTASSGSDYTAIGATALTFSAGQINKTVVVTTTEDSVAESTETLSVNLSGAVDGTITDGTGTGTIVDDDSFTVAVNSTSDTADSNPGNGVCSDAGGQCSLRAALEEINASNYSVAATINIGAGTYTLSAGELVATKPVHLIGVSPASTIIDAGNASRVLNLTISSTDKTTLENLTLTGGNSGSGNGGAVLASGSGSLELINVDVTSSTASSGGGDGGGMYVGAGINLTVRDSLLSGNSTGSAGGHGGGIYYAGSTLLIEDSDLLNNSAFADGGGLYVSTAGASVNLLRSSMEGNTGGGDGGGTYVANSLGALLIDRSTFTGNAGTTTADLYLVCTTVGVCFIQSSTFAAPDLTSVTLVGASDLDVSFSTLTTDYAAGGVIAGTGGTPTLTTQGTIFANSGGITGCSGLSVTSQDYNLSTSNDCSLSSGNDISSATFGDLFTASTPAAYGGPTKTLELKTGSPAIDAGGTLCDNTDQRGLTRPVNKVGGAYCDIGAFEVQ